VRSATAARLRPPTATAGRPTRRRGGAAAAAGRGYPHETVSLPASGPACSMTRLFISLSSDWLVHLPSLRPAALRSLREPTSWQAVEGTRHRRWRKPGGSPFEPPGTWRRVGGGESVAYTPMSHRETGRVNVAKRKAAGAMKKRRQRPSFFDTAREGVRRAVSEGRWGGREETGIAVGGRRQRHA
jgi:hypothetical protein